MNCQSFGNVVVDLARSLPLETGVRDEALAHRSSCDSCARWLEEEKMLTVGLQALATEMKAATAPDLEQNLISALREQRFVPQTSQMNRWPYLAVAAAVLIAVGLTIVVLRMKQPTPVEPQVRSAPPVQSETPNVAPSPAKRAQAVQPVKVKSALIAVVNRRPKKRQVSEELRPTFVSVVVGSITDPEAPEVASTFMPLGYTNTASIQEGAQVVRVEMPRYAMARFGLPVNMERYDERVKADVWLGADGLARAIRFVQ